MQNAIRFVFQFAAVLGLLVGLMYANDIHRWLTSAPSNDVMVFHAVTMNDPAMFDRTATEETVNARDALGLTPLCYAAKQGDATWIDRLTGRGARVNDKAREGLTPLMYAAQGNNVAACRMLLERGADADIRATVSGQTALDLARQNKAWDCAELLTHTATRR